MSVQSAREFVKRIESDMALQQRLQAAADLDVRHQIIKEAGYDFSLNAYNKVIEELTMVSGEELTPEELQQVAGGLGVKCMFLC